MHSKYDEIREKLDNYIERLPKPDPEWPQDVRRAIAFIHKHLFDQRLTVRWVKEKCRINDKNFSAKFKFYTEKSIQQYWLEHRTEMAGQLLKNTNSNGILLAEYAFGLGFRSPSAFSMTFKKYTGCTPSEYQAKHIF